MTKQEFQSLDRLADSFNPLLTILLLGVLVFAAYRSREFRPWAFLGRFVLALLVTYVIAHVNRWFLWWPEHPKFPSGHTTYAACVITSLCLLHRGWLLLFPVLGAYGALIVVLGFHIWLDVIVAALFAPVVTMLCHRKANFRRKLWPAKATPSL